MRKIFMAGISAAASVLLLAGCNKQMIDLTYEYSQAQIKMPGGTVIEGKVDSWNDYEGDQLQVKINGTTYLVHSSNVILWNGAKAKSGERGGVHRMKFDGVGFTCVRCGKQTFVNRLADGTLNINALKGWELSYADPYILGVVGDVCPKCFKEYRNTIEEFWGRKES